MHCLSRPWSKKLLRILILGWLFLALTCPAMAQPPPVPGSPPQILEFHRKHCPVCKESGEIVQAVQARYPGQFTVRRLYIDEEEHVYRRYRVAIVPALVFLDASGREVFRHEGVLPQGKLLEKLRELKFIRE